MTGLIAFTIALLIAAAIIAIHDRHDQREWRRFQAEVMASRNIELTVFEDLEGNEHLIAVRKDHA